MARTNQRDAEWERQKEEAIVRILKKITWFELESWTESQCLGPRARDKKNYPNTIKNKAATFLSEWYTCINDHSENDYAHSHCCIEATCTLSTAARLYSKKEAGAIYRAYLRLEEDLIYDYNHLVPEGLWKNGEFNGTSKT
jgi:hypothetical protein